MVRKLALMVMALGIVSLVIGAVFIGLAFQKNNYVVSSLRAQGVTLGLTKDQIAAGELVDSAPEAQIAADTLATHLTSIAPTYGALMAKSKTGKFDPTDPTQLDYAQGLNMENTFDTVILGFGVIQATMATGAALIVIGLAVGVTGFGLFRLGR
ncbi:MAG TPA: hypothetical protein VF318_04305 [Dehalococcoidales bacterium]|jgi:hypothetical protein